MSIGTGKGWRRWRNQASARGKQLAIDEELKSRFGQNGQKPMNKPKPLVSDDEVRAAKLSLESFAKAAGRDQPLPDSIIRFVLEEAAMVRVGMKRLPAEPR